MQNACANDNVSTSDGRQWSVDLSQLSRENGIPIEDMRAHLSWIEKPGDLSTMELAHRYKRASGWERTVILIALMGRYAKPA